MLRIDVRVIRYSKTNQKRNNMVKKNQLTGKEYFLAVISHKRPENVEKIARIVGGATFFVNRAEKGDYANAGAHKVIPCGDDICAARNRAIEEAKEYGVPCVQVSDDLRRIKRFSLKAGKRVSVEITFDDAVGILLKEMRMRKAKFAGVAVTSNQLNYTGVDFSYDKLIVNDLIIVDGTKFDAAMWLKEDYDLCIHELIYTGVIVRANHILCDFPHRENKGGANSYRTSPVEAAQTKRLFAKWGPHIKPHPTRAGQISLNYPVIQATRAEVLRNSKGKRN